MRQIASVLALLAGCAPAPVTCPPPFCGEGMGVLCERPDGTRCRVDIVVCERPDGTLCSDGEACDDGTPQCRRIAVPTSEVVSGSPVCVAADTYDAAARCE
jgi:hypothetical protein